MKTPLELYKCLKRELGKRKSAYPRWVSQLKMSQKEATHEIDCMEELVAIYHQKGLDEGWLQVAGQVSLF